MATDYEFACEAQVDRLIVKGDCDSTAARRLTEAIADYDGRAVEIDCTGVTFFDSAALRVLLRAHERNPHMWVGPMSQDVAVVLKISGTYKLLRRSSADTESDVDTRTPA